MVRGYIQSAQTLITAFHHTAHFLMMGSGSVGVKDFNSVMGGVCEGVTLWMIAHIGQRGNQAALASFEPSRDYSLPDSSCFC